MDIEKLVSELFESIRLGENSSSGYDRILEDNLDGVVGMVNLGRDRTAIERCKKVEYSAVMDRRTCPLCQELDGMVVDVRDGDYARYMPPIHGRCRCIYVYIEEDEVNQPGYSVRNIDPELIRQHGHLIGGNKMENSKLPEGQQTVQKSMIVPNTVSLDKLSKWNEQVFKGFTTSNKNALKDFQGGYFGIINKQLRQDNILSQRAVNIDNAFKNARPYLKEPITVFRGTDLFPFPKNVKEAVGKTFTDKGFGSTSIDKGVSAGYAKDGVLIEMRISPNSKTKTIPVGNSVQEAEILLNRGYSYKVLDVLEMKDTQYKYHMIVELL